MTSKDIRIGQLWKPAYLAGLGSAIVVAIEGISGFSNPWVTIEKADGTRSEVTGAFLTSGAYELVSTAA